MEEDMLNFVAKKDRQEVKLWQILKQGF